MIKTKLEKDFSGFFDEERLIQYLEKPTTKKLNPLVKGLFFEVMKFAGIAAQPDNVMQYLHRLD